MQQDARNTTTATLPVESEDSGTDSHVHFDPVIKQYSAHLKPPLCATAADHSHEDLEFFNDGNSSKKGTTRKNLRTCWRHLPPWVVRILYQSLVIILVLVPTVVEQLVARSDILVAGFRISFWSIYFAICLGILFLLFWLIALVFYVLSSMYDYRIHTRTKETIEIASLMQEMIAICIWSFAILISWITWKARECHLILESEDCALASSGQSSPATNTAKSCKIPPSCPNSNGGAADPLSWITPVMYGLAITSTLLLIERAIFQTISVRFQKTEYKERIEKSRFAARVLDNLNEARKIAKRLRIKSNKKGNGQKSHYDSMRSTFSSSPSEKTPSIQNHSPWTPEFPSEYGEDHEKRLEEDTIGLGQTITNILDFKISPSRTLRSKETADDTSSEAPASGGGGDDVPFLSSVQRARIVARKLFLFLCPPDSSSIEMEDFMPFFESHYACKRAFDLFDKDGNGQISRLEFHST